MLSVTVDDQNILTLHYEDQFDFLLYNGASSKSNEY